MTAQAPHLSELRFRAMGTEAHVLVVGAGADLCDTALRRIEDLERKWSRFVPESEVSHLDDSPREVSADTALLLARAAEAAALTGGRFDPTVSVAALGYDRSFERLAPADEAAPAAVARPGRGAGAIHVDGRTAWLDPGSAFDPGGIGKGLAADLVVAELLAAGAAGACVNLGGDLRAEGEAPDGEGWVVEVADPFGGPPVGMIDLAAGAAATSTDRRRRWGPPAGRLHHLVDPRTGRPGVSPFAAVTVVDAEAWRAEAVAKSLWLAGDLTADDGAIALAVVSDGTLVHGSGIGRFLV